MDEELPETAIWEKGELQVPWEIVNGGWYEGYTGHRGFEARVR